LDLQKDGCLDLEKNMLCMLCKGSTDKLSEGRWHSAAWYTVSNSLKHTTVEPVCATPIHSSNTPQLSQQAVADLYGKGLAATADLQREATQPDTLKTL